MSTEADAKAKADRELFAKQLRVRLAELDWNAPRLVREYALRGIEVSRQQISEWTKGVYPKGAVAAFLPRVLGVTAEWLFLATGDTKEGRRGMVAAHVARALEQIVLTGNGNSLLLVAGWLSDLAEKLQKIDPTYDTLELRQAADKVRELATA